MIWAVLYMIHIRMLFLQLIEWSCIGLWSHPEYMWIIFICDMAFLQQQNLRCVLSWCSKSLFCYYDRMCHDGIKPVLVFFFYFFFFSFFSKFKILQINVYIKKSVSPKRCQSDASIAIWIWFVTSLLMSLIFNFYTEIVLVNIWDRECYIN